MDFLIASAGDTTIQSAVITSVGLIIVSLIGVFTARATAGSRRDAKASQDSAALSAQIAEEHAIAIKTKDEFIDSLKGRLDYIEKRLDDCERREAARSTEKR